MTIQLPVNGYIFKFLSSIIDQIDWKVCPYSKERYYVYHYSKDDERHRGIVDYEGLFKRFIENKILLEDVPDDEREEGVVKPNFKELTYILDIGPNALKFTCSIAKRIYELLNIEEPEDYRHITYGVDMNALATQLYQSFPSFFRSPSIAPNFIDVFIKLEMFDSEEVLFQDTNRRYKLIRMSALGEIAFKP